jgi:hypothetical protein
MGEVQLLQLREGHNTRQASSVQEGAGLQDKLGEVLM